MRPSPKSIKASEGNVQIVWNDGHASSYSGRTLRLACKCAACIDEWTHQVTIQADKIPPVVKPMKIDVVGNYAFHFAWSDGHDTGIYSYDYLRTLCECPECKK
jgi:DUF971 family protein